MAFRFICFLVLLSWTAIGNAQCPSLPPAPTLEFSDTNPPLALLQRKHNISQFLLAMDNYLQCETLSPAQAEAALELLTSTRTRLEQLLKP